MARFKERCRFRQTVQTDRDWPHEATTGVDAGYLDDFAPAVDAFLDEQVEEGGGRPQTQTSYRRKPGRAEFVEDMTAIDPLP